MRHPLRLVQSTGDIVNNSLRARLPAFAITEGRTELSQEDGLFRIGKYTLDERRLRILRYRQKRHERNFDRKIKYACRKTLADSRPRVRGRFAKNEGPEAAGAAGDGSGRSTAAGARLRFSRSWWPRLLLRVRVRVRADAEA